MLGSTALMFRAPVSYRSLDRYHVHVELDYHHITNESILRRKGVTYDTCEVPVVFEEGETRLTAGLIEVGQKYLEGQMYAAFDNLFFLLFAHACNTPPPPHPPAPCAGQFLDLDRDLAEGFHPITERARRGLQPARDLRASWEERVGAFRTCLPPVGEPRSIVLRDIMVLVALRCGYDARTRCVFLGLVGLTVSIGVCFDRLFPFDFWFGLVWFSLVWFGIV